MKHIKLYEDQDLLDDMRDLTILPKMHSYYVIAMGYDKGEGVYGYAVTIIGTEWAKLCGDIFNKLGIGEIDMVNDLIEMKELLPDIESLIENISAVFLKGYEHLSFKTVVWEMKPKSEKFKAEVIEIENIVDAYKIGKDNFIDFDNIIRKYKKGLKELKT